MGKHGVPAHVLVNLGGERDAAARCAGALSERAATLWTAVRNTNAADSLMIAIARYSMPSKNFDKLELM